ncbi:MAG: hypothetical protein KTR25_12270 [Myxococcales bacterium]|nr:hypothetical protein [Myxococcales bacterium]
MEGVDNIFSNAIEVLYGDVIAIKGRIAVLEELTPLAKRLCTAEVTSMTVPDKAKSQIRQYTIRHRRMRPKFQEQPANSLMIRLINHFPTSHSEEYSNQLRFLSFLYPKYALSSLEYYKKDLSQTILFEHSNRPLR